MATGGSIAIIDCWIEKIEGRKVWTKGIVSDGAERIFSQGEGLYLKVPLEHFDAMPEEFKARFKKIE